MIRWLPEDWPTQHSADGKYAVVQATRDDPWFVAYALHHPAIGVSLGEFRTPADARGACEAHSKERAT